MPEWRHSVADWQRTLCGLFDRNLRIGMPLPPESTTFREVERQARNAEETLLAAIDGCARVTRQLSDIAWPDNTSAGKLLHRLQGQRVTQTEMRVIIGYVARLRPYVVPSCLSHLKIGAEQLCLQDLESADLEGTDLKGANLKDADLKAANLKGANLEGAYLEGADLVSADLRGADLRGANLRGTNLEGADLRGADLRGADLEDANLEYANLDGANLKGIDFELILKQHPNFDPNEED
jgi:uncharacterized protein YjbI with pentapeptide repeats